MALKWLLIFLALYLMAQGCLASALTVAELRVIRVVSTLLGKSNSNCVLVGGAMPITRNIADFHQVISIDRSGTTRTELLEKLWKHLRCSVIIVQAEGFELETMINAARPLKDHIILAISSKDPRTQTTALENLNSPLVWYNTVLAKHHFLSRRTPKVT